VSTDAESSKIELTVAAESDRYDAADDRWLAQANDLYADLRRDVSGYRVESTQVTGTKGVVDAAILALGSAGAFSAAVQCIKAWLARDKSRRVAITWTQGGQEQRVVLEGDAIDVKSLQRLVEAIGQRLGGG
jgi:hypothetical protein